MKEIKITIEDPKYKVGDNLYLIYLGEHEKYEIKSVVLTHVEAYMRYTYVPDTDCLTLKYCEYQYFSQNEELDEEDLYPTLKEAKIALADMYLNDTIN